MANEAVNPCPKCSSEMIQDTVSYGVYTIYEGIWCCKGCGYTDTVCPCNKLSGQCEVHKEM